jgi:hypothetical protein
MDVTEHAVVTCFRGRLLPQKKFFCMFYAMPDHAEVSEHIPIVGVNLCAIDHQQR